MGNPIREDFEKQREAYKKRVATDAGIFPDGSRAYANSVASTQQEIGNFFGPARVPTNVANYDLAQQSAQLLTLSEQQLQAQFTKGNNLETILEHAPLRGTENPDVIALYELPAGKEYDPIRKAHGDFLKIAQQINKDPGKALTDLRKKKERLYFNALDNAFPLANKKDKEAFARVNAQAISREELGEEVTRAKKEFLDALKLGNANNYAAAAFRATVNKYVTDKNLDIAMELAEDPLFIFKKVQEEQRKAA